MRNSLRISHFIILLFVAIWLVVFTSWIGSIYEWPVQSLLSPEGIRWALRHVDENFHQTPFVSVLVLLVGLGPMYASGFFHVLGQHIRRISIHKPLSRKQKRALLLSLISGAVYLLLVGIATFSPLAILLGVTGTLERSPFIEGFVPLISFAFFLIGLVFGIASGQFYRFREVIQGMGSLFPRSIPYFIFLLMASQFMGILHYSQLDSYMGIDETGEMVLRALLYYLPLISILTPHKP